MDRIEDLVKRARKYKELGAKFEDGDAIKKAEQLILKHIQSLNNQDYLRDRWDGSPARFDLVADFNLTNDERIIQIFTDYFENDLPQIRDGTYLDKKLISHRWHKSDLEAAKKFNLPNLESIARQFIEEGISILNGERTYDNHQFTAISGTRYWVKAKDIEDLEFALKVAEIDKSDYTDRVTRTMAGLLSKGVELNVYEGRYTFDTLATCVKLKNLFGYNKKGLSELDTNKALIPFIYNLIRSTLNAEFERYGHNAQYYDKLKSKSERDWKQIWDLLEITEIQKQLAIIAAAQEYINIFDGNDDGEVNRHTVIKYKRLVEILFPEFKIDPTSIETYLDSKLAEIISNKPIFGYWIFEELHFKPTGSSTRQELLEWSILASIEEGGIGSHDYSSSPVADAYRLDINLLDSALAVYQRLRTIDPVVATILGGKIITNKQEYPMKSGEEFKIRDVRDTIHETASNAYEKELSEYDSKSDIKLIRRIERWTNSSEKILNNVFKTRVDRLLSLGDAEFDNELSSIGHMSRTFPLTIREYCKELCNLYTDLRDSSPDNAYKLAKQFQLGNFDTDIKTQLEAYELVHIN